MYHIIASVLHLNLTLSQQALQTSRPTSRWRQNLDRPTIMNTRQELRCPICSQVFPNRGNRRRHMISVHTRLRPFACRHCGRHFSDSSNCQRHEKTTCTRDLEPGAETSLARQQSYPEAASSIPDGTDGRLSTSPYLYRAVACMHAPQSSQVAHSVLSAAGNGAHSHYSGAEPASASEYESMCEPTPWPSQQSTTSRAGAGAWLSPPHWQRLTTSATVPPTSLMMYTSAMPGAPNYHPDLLCRTQQAPGPTPAPPSYLLCSPPGRAGPKPQPAAPPPLRPCFPQYSPVVLFPPAPCLPNEGIFYNPPTSILPFTITPDRVPCLRGQLPDSPHTGSGMLGSSVPYTTQADVSAALPSSSEQVSLPTTPHGVQAPKLEDPQRIVCSQSVARVLCPRPVYNCEWAQVVQHHHTIQRFQAQTGPAAGTHGPL